MPSLGEGNFKSRITDNKQIQNSKLQIRNILNFGYWNL
jgi:hypothetical protein